MAATASAGGDDRGREDRHVALGASKAAFAIDRDIATS